jgi:hypothetical protein
MKAAIRASSASLQFSPRNRECKMPQSNFADEMKLACRYCATIARAKLARFLLSVRAIGIGPSPGAVRDSNSHDFNAPDRSLFPDNCAPSLMPPCQHDAKR